MVQLATAPLSPVLWQTEENKSCLDGRLAKILNTYIKIQNIASFRRSRLMVKQGQLHLNITYAQNQWLCKKLFSG